MNPQQAERKQYTARARPLLEGHSQYRRAGQSFGLEPTTITLLPPGVAPSSPGEVTPEQFAVIEADANISLREVSTAQPAKAPKDPAESVSKQTEEKRLDEQAKDAEKHNVRGR